MQIKHRFSVSSKCKEHTLGSPGGPITACLASTGLNARGKYFCTLSALLNMRNTASSKEALFVESSHLYASIRLAYIFISLTWQRGARVKELLLNLSSYEFCTTLYYLTLVFNENGFQRCFMVPMST